MSAIPIRPLAEADASCGAKAHGLARLIAAGLPVPDGFVLEPAAFRDAAAITEVAPDVGIAPFGDLAWPIGHALAAAAERIAAAEPPAPLARELAARAAALGRLAVRSSASLEDGALGAAAGVFASLTDVAPGEVWPAIRAVWTSALTPLAVAYARHRGAAIAIAVIVQRFVPGARVTIYTRPIGAPGGDELWIAQGDGLARLPRTAAAEPGDLAGASGNNASREPARLEAALALAAEAAIACPSGADVELVLEATPRDANDGRPTPRPWIVQARPILHRSARSPRPAPPPILLAALVADGRRWTWDIAHNPDPLSPAQAGLVERVDRAAWSPHALRVCGGYLYMTPRAPIAPPAPPADRDELAQRIAEIEARLRPLLRDTSPADVAHAVERYVAFLQIWLCELSPLVAVARRRLFDRLAGTGHPLERIPALAAALIGPRRAPRDPVMSPAWDVAVPTFGEARSQPVPDRERPLAPPPAPPDDLAAEVALARAAADAAEHDDVWFARAQWLVRSALLARSQELDLRGDDIFWIALDDVVTLRTLDPDDVHRRASAARAAHARAAEWDMPLTVHGAACGESPRDLTDRRSRIAGGGDPDGSAGGAGDKVPRGIEPLRGTGSGPRRTGRVVRFASLAAARPVAHTDVVVTRAVTPALAMLVDGCAALVSETGGLLDHGASLARELGATCVVGCAGAWSRLADGALVSVDGDAGLVIVHDPEI